MLVCEIRDALLSGVPLESLDDPFMLNFSISDYFVSHFIILLFLNEGNVLNKWLVIFVSIVSPVEYHFCTGHFCGIIFANRAENLKN